MEDGLGKQKACIFPDFYFDFLLQATWDASLCWESCKAIVEEASAGLLFLAAWVTWYRCRSHLQNVSESDDDLSAEYRRQLESLKMNCQVLWMLVIPTHNRGLYEQLIMSLPHKMCWNSAFNAPIRTMESSVFGPWGMWCKRRGWSLAVSMAQLSSLWRDLGLNLVLRCLTGSALMWLSNHAYCCFMASQRAASFPAARFSASSSPEASVSGRAGRRREGKSICEGSAALVLGKSDGLSNIWAIKPNGLNISGNIVSMKDVVVPNCVNMYMIYLAASCKCKRSKAYATRGTLMAHWPPYCLTSTFLYYTGRFWGKKTFPPATKWNKWLFFLSNVATMQANLLFLQCNLDFVRFI